MKLATKDTLIEETSLPSDSIKEFTVKADGVAFDILTKNLYSNPVQSVIREISCNAMDAHILAGKSNQPIEVTLPGRFNNVFSVKDYGPGLSEEDIYSLFTTVFGSSKRGENISMGGFGLGSKSPFAVASTFSVESRNGGMVKTYVMTKDEGMPKVIKVEERPFKDGENTGITVSINVPNNSNYSNVWQDEADYVFKFWDVQPIVDGKTKTNPEPIIKGNGFNVYSEGYGGAYVKIGMVTYPVNNTINVPACFPYYRATIIDIPIGTVTIAPSREDLVWDDKTIKVIQGAVNRVEKAFLQTIQQQVDTWENIVNERHFIMNLDNFSETLNLRLHYLAKHITFNGKLVDPNITRDAYTLSGFLINTRGTQFIVENDYIYDTTTTPKSRKKVWKDLFNYTYTGPDFHSLSECGVIIDDMGLIDLFKSKGSISGFKEAVDFRKRVATLYKESDINRWYFLSKKDWENFFKTRWNVDVNEHILKDWSSVKFIGNISSVQPLEDAVTTNTNIISGSRLVRNRQDVGDFIYVVSKDINFRDGYSNPSGLNHLRGNFPSNNLFSSLGDKVNFYAKLTWSTMDKSMKEKIKKIAEGLGKNVFLFMDKSYKSFKEQQEDGLVTNTWVDVLNKDEMLEYAKGVISDKAKFIYQLGGAFNNNTVYRLDGNPEAKDKRLVKLTQLAKYERTNKFLVKEEISLINLLRDIYGFKFDTLGSVEKLSIMLNDLSIDYQEFITSSYLGSLAPKFRLYLLDSIYEKEVLPKRITPSP